MNRSNLVIEVKIFVAYRFWISRYGSDFKKNETLGSLLNEFHEMVEREEEKAVIHLSNM